MPKKTFRKHEDDILQKFIKEVLAEWGYVDMQEVWKRYNLKYGNENDPSWLAYYYICYTKLTDTQQFPSHHTLSTRGSKK